jgi:putative addiction module component (TIGR02574 family)
MNYPTREEIKELAPEQRLQLIEDIEDTLEIEPESLELSESHRDVIEDRLQQL